MKHICEGHEYTTHLYDDGHLDCLNNYGTLVAVATLSDCAECHYFATIGDDSGDSYHVSELGGYFSVEEQLVRWFAAVSS